MKLLLVLSSIFISSCVNIEDLQKPGSTQESTGILTEDATLFFSNFEKEQTLYKINSLGFRWGSPIASFSSYRLHPTNKALVLFRNYDWDQYSNQWVISPQKELVKLSDTYNVRHVSVQYKNDTWDTLIYKGDPYTRKVYSEVNDTVYQNMYIDSNEIFHSHIDNNDISFHYQESKQLKNTSIELLMTNPSIDGYFYPDKDKVNPDFRFTQQSKYYHYNINKKKELYDISLNHIVLFNYIEESFDTLTTFEELIEISKIAKLPISGFDFRPDGEGNIVDEEDSGIILGSWTTKTLGGKDLYILKLNQNKFNSVDLKNREMIFMEHDGYLFQGVHYHENSIIEDLFFFNKSGINDLLNYFGIEAAI